MARRDKTITITNEGRDKDKRFLITELPASKTEEFSMLMIENFSSLDPETIKQLQEIAKSMSNTQALASIETSKLDPKLAKILFNGIEDYLFLTLDYLQVGNSIEITKENADNFIEEASTRFELKQQFMEMHIGFLQKGNT